MKVIHPTALFRSTVLEPLISRDRLERGDLKSTIKELSSHSYNIPGSRNHHLSEKTTIEAWYYAWRRGGIEALTPRPRSDRGQSKIPPNIRKPYWPPNVRTRVVPLIVLFVYWNAGVRSPKGN